LREVEHMIYKRYISIIQFNFRTTFFNELTIKKKEKGIKFNYILSL